MNDYDNDAIIRAEKPTNDQIPEIIDSQTTERCEENDPVVVADPSTPKYRKRAARPSDITEPQPKKPRNK